MRTRVLVTGAALLGVAFVVVLRIPGLSDLAVLLISNLGQLLAAVLASVGCALAARRTRDQRRRAWRWLSVGAASWAAGQAVWSYYEIVLDREVPFPSLADVGFLLFPVAAAIGLVTWLGSQSDQLVARGRDVLDGADHRVVPAGGLLGHRARVGRGGRRRRLVAAHPLAGLPGQRPDPWHAGPARARPWRRLRTRDPGRAGPRPRRPRGLGQRLRLPGRAGAVLLGRPGQQRLGDRLPARRHGRADGATGAGGRRAAAPAPHRSRGRRRAVRAAAAAAVPPPARRRRRSRHEADDRCPRPRRSTCCSAPRS